MKKRLIRFFIPTIIIAFFSMITVVFALTTDTEPPILKTLNITKTEAIGGEKLPVTINITDDISGIARVLVRFQGASSESFNDIYFETLVSNNQIIIPTNAKPGKYVLTFIYTEDNAGNYRAYQADFCKVIDCGNYDNEYNVNWGNIVLEIKPSGADITPPVVKWATIDKSNYRVGESVIFKAQVTDNKSGVQTVRACISNENEGGCKFIYLEPDSINSDNYTATYVLPNLNSKYVITKFEVLDNAQNTKNYYIYKDKDETLFNYASFNVTGGVEDLESPKLVSISFEKTEIKAPYNLRVKATTSDDASGVSLVYVTIQKYKNGKYEDISLNGVPLICDLNTKANKTQECSAELNISQYYENGEYVITDITVVDNAEKTTKYNIEGKNGEILSKVSFKITDVFKYDIISSTKDKEIIKKIKDASDGSNIAIDSSQNPKVKKEIFEAIQGTNKTLYIESNGITWVFNGKDIVNLKGINTDVTINMLYNDQLNSEVGDVFNKAIIISFAKNGKLPGKALVRIKADYTLSNYIGEEDLLVYYYKGNKRFNRVAEEINITSDGYYEFYINHNSEFIIANNRVDEEYLDDDESMLTLNENIIDENDDVKGEEEINNNKIIYLVIGTTIILLVGTIFFIKRKSISKNKKILV